MPGGREKAVLQVVVEGKGLPHPVIIFVILHLHQFIRVSPLKLELMIGKVNPGRNSARVLRSV